MAERRKSVQLGCLVGFLFVCLFFQKEGGHSTKLQEVVGRWGRLTGRKGLEVSGYYQRSPHCRARASGKFRQWSAWKTVQAPRCSQETVPKFLTLVQGLFMIGSFTLVDSSKAINSTSKLPQPRLATPWLYTARSFATYSC